MENKEKNNPSSQESKWKWVDRNDNKSGTTNEVKQFNKNDFKKILILFFKSPIEGIYTLLKSPSEKSYTQSLVLFSSVFIFYLFGGSVIVGDAMRSFDFIDFIKIGTVPVIIMFLISCLSFTIKSFSGKPNFKNELLTGGLCAIPLGLLIPVLFVIKIFYYLTIFLFNYLTI